MQNNKLELTWYGKDKEPVLEPRILLEDKSKSFSVEPSISLLESKVTFNNMLIHGDNLLALKALQKSFFGKVKCAYIDPPYNTGSAFVHYDDNLQHSIWLSLMKPRIELLRSLLSDDGSLWISIDADEEAYLKVLCDEIFGRSNFVDQIVWQRAYSPVNLKKTLSRSHDIILVYAKKLTKEFSLNPLERSEEANNRYKNPDNDSRGPWKAADMSVGPRVEANVYEIVTPSGRKVLPPSGRSWVLSKPRFDEMIKDNRIWFGPTGNNVPARKKFLSEVKQGVVSTTWWIREEVGDNQDAKREVKSFGFKDQPFDTPKPEKLIKRILTLATNEGDLVLDSFLGSGTTAAVAQKMNRRWIGIEMEQTAYLFCKPRLDMVISGKDKGGITKSTGYEGGGGYKFYELAPTLVVNDAFGEPIINKKYNADMLASAVALHEGFTYSPDKEHFWKQSKASENSYLFVTTMHIDSPLLDKIANDMTKDEFLIIACKTFDEECSRLYKNIVIKKIPEMLLGKCEFGKDDYSLNIINPPTYEDEDEDEDNEK